MLLLICNIWYVLVLIVICSEICSFHLKLLQVIYLAGNSQQVYYHYSWDTSYTQKLTFKAANAMHFCIVALKPDQNKQTYPNLYIFCEIK